MTLTRERVIAAALAIVDRDGIDRLTMRALGSELGVDPMAAYHHLPSKAAVLDGVVEAVLSEIPLATPAGPWEERLAALARGYRAALRAHPNALPLVATRPDVTPVALRLLDSAVGILLEAGATPAAAVTTVHAISVFVVGHALDESGEPAPAPELDAYPHLAAIASVEPGDTFEAGLAALIAGLARLGSPG
jgi:TetR/AcrR family tetracycline transcriptional repressor